MLPAPTPATKPLDWFQTPPLAVTDYIKELAASIVQQGLLHPILAVETREVLAGRHRLAALKHAGLKDAPALIYPSSLTPAQRRVVTLTENLHRKEMADAEVYTLCRELLELNPDWKRQDLAAHLAKSPGMVTQYLSPDDLIPEAREAFLAGKFGLSVAYSISKSKDQLSALHDRLGGATRDQINGRNRKREGAVRASKIKCPLPSGYVVTVSGADASLEEAVEALGEAVKAMKAMLGRGYSAKTFERAMRDMAANG